MSEVLALPSKRSDCEVRQQRPPTRVWFPWAVHGYTLLVILFGAVVRVTGSGAGCGQHWPTCHGEVAHLPQTVETVIEFSHRLTSGLSLLLVLALVVFVRRRVPPGHLARSFAWLSLVFLVLEALLGAGLVLFDLVADSTAVARAFVMPAHLLNTSLLMLCLTLTAWGLSRAQPLLELRTARACLMLGGLLLLLLVSGTGAVTALGDTLYPVSQGAPLVERMVEAQSGKTVIERMRSLHPLLAIFAALYLFVVASFVDKLGGKLNAKVEPLAGLVIAALLAQLVLGVVNVWLSAPGWLQVLHLAGANLVWLLWVLLSAELLDAGPVSVRS